MLFFALGNAHEAKIITLQSEKILLKLMNQGLLYSFDEDADFEHLIGKRISCFTKDQAQYIIYYLSKEDEYIWA